MLHLSQHGIKINQRRGLVMLLATTRFSAIAGGVERSEAVGLFALAVLTPLVFPPARIRALEGTESL